MSGAARRSEISANAVAAAVRALSRRARGPLVAVTPDGPLGSPFEGYPLDSVAVNALGAVEVRLGEEHLLYVLTDARILSENEVAPSMSAAELTEEFTAYGQEAAPARRRVWTEATLLLTYDPQTAQGTRSRAQR